MTTSMNTHLKQVADLPACIKVQSPADLNVINTAFWDRENTLRDDRFKDPLLVDLLTTRLFSPRFSCTPVRYQPSIEQILQEAEEQRRIVLARCEASIRQDARTEQARRAGKSKTPDALQQIIIDLVRRNPSITGTQLLTKLADDPRVEVTEGEISFERQIGNYNALKTVRVSGLKDRLSRAKRLLNSR